MTPPGDGRRRTARRTAPTVPRRYRGRTVPQHHHTPSAGRRAGVALLLGIALSFAAACSSDSDDGRSGGFETPREVVDAHVARSAAYDLVADCELRHPDFIAEMAAIDGRDPEGYCEWALSSLLANATPEERAATEAKYTDPTITAGPADDDQAAFVLEAADGSYHEDIVVVQVDGRWFLRSADGTDDEHDHEH